MERLYWYWNGTQDPPRAIIYIQNQNKLKLNKTEVKKKECLHNWWVLLCVYIIYTYCLTLLLNTGEYRHLTERKALHGYIMAPCYPSHPAGFQ